MMNRLRFQTAVVLASVTLAGTACGGGRDNSAAATATPPAVATPAPTAAAPVATPTPAPAAAPVTPEHHSKLGGAVAGGVVGHMVGGKKGALLGAAAGAYIQHRRNKAAERQAAAANAGTTP